MDLWKGYFLYMFDIMNKGIILLLKLRFNSFLLQRFFLPGVVYTTMTLFEEMLLLLKHFGFLFVFAEFVYSLLNSLLLWVFKSITGANSFLLSLLKFNNWLIFLFVVVNFELLLRWFILRSSIF